MTIWVTGADGFIGRHLVSHLAGAGERVLGLGHRDQAGPDSHVDRIEGDCDLSLFRAAGARTGAPRVIYHLAGGGSVGRSYEAPIDDFQRTVAVTAILLEWIRCEAPSARLVFVSSAAIYGDGHSGVIASVHVRGFQFRSRRQDRASLFDLWGRVAQATPLGLLSAPHA
jgi:UDP-glucose 4-epimerase